MNNTNKFSNNNNTTNKIIYLQVIYSTKVRVPTLNLLIIVIPTSTNYKIYYCNNCPTLGPSLSSQLRPLVNNPTLTQVLPPYRNHLAAHKAKQLNNQHPKSHHLISLIKNHKHKKLRNTHTQSLLLSNLQIDLILLDTPPLYPTIDNPIPPIKVKCKYTKRKHNNNNNKKLHKLYWHTLRFYQIRHSPHPHLYQLLHELHNLIYLITQTLQSFPLRQ